MLFYFDVLYCSVQSHKKLLYCISAWIDLHKIFEEVIAASSNIPDESGATEEEDEEERETPHHPSYCHFPSPGRP